jgi:3D-(3,5/4)-trihydroxycyclohexane-1,2-dione acylhydrolase (decyclizing)
MNDSITQQRIARATIIAEHGGLENALEANVIGPMVEITLSEALVLGLLRQQVTRFIGVFGHGSTEIGEVLRIYQNAGLVKTFAVRHEIEAVHAATALRWVTGEKAAVITSIGPGALHALAGSLAPLSNGLGVWFLLGDETTQDEGPNMQQIPGDQQNQFHRLFSAMGPTYTLHTPEAIGTAMRRGLSATEHPFRQSPFYLLMPMNTQARLIKPINLSELPTLTIPSCCCLPDETQLQKAVETIRQANRIVVKVGGGAKGVSHELIEFLERVDGVAVGSPLVAGVIPFSHQRNMTVGGSKGSLSGNFAMVEADLLIAMGTRSVCQSDCSRTGYPKVKAVININTDLNTVLHYAHTIPLLGDLREIIPALNKKLNPGNTLPNTEPSPWLIDCIKKRKEWDRFRAQRYETPTLFDEVWQTKVLTQPAAIKTASDWALQNEAKLFFDAGDVQANGFQIVEAEKPGMVYTETGSSYMGFAVSALLSTAISQQSFYGVAFTGDGSFTMNPQILIDGVEHGAKGCIVLLDNRRMGAISGLQQDQYGHAYATSDSVEVDYMAWAKSIKGISVFDGGFSTQSLLAALQNARRQNGLSLVYVRVYFGNDPLGDMGVFGCWNVGNWCEEIQAIRHQIGL